MNIIKCDSCGAKITVNSIKQINCDFCGVEVKIDNILTDIIKFNGNKADYIEFSKHKKLLISAMNVNDFKNSYELLIKLTSIDPTNPKLWEFTAKYHFSSKKFSYNNEDFSLFKNYFNNHNNLSDEGSIIFLDLIDQMYSIFFEKYINIEYDKSMSGKVWDSFSDEKIIFLINFLEISELHFDCFSDEKVLQRVVLELSGHSKSFWLYSNLGKVETVRSLNKFNFDAISFRKKIIDILLLNDNTYTEPEINYQNNLPGSNSNGNCFIATVCYENFNHPNVILLRKFRDNSLYSCNLGKFMVNIYYRLSPSISNYLRDKRIVILSIKFIILYPLTKFIKLWEYLDPRRRKKKKLKPKQRLN